MRWHELFEDLEARWREQALAERAGEVSERTRHERAQITLGDRLRAQEGPLELRVVGELAVTGEVVDVGPDWVSVEQAGGRTWLLRLDLIQQLSGLGRIADPATGSAVARRFGFGSALRALARDRAVVVVHDRDGRPTTGTIDAVGADAIDLSEHLADQPRRVGDVRAVRTIPFAAMAAVTSA